MGVILTAQWGQSPSSRPVAPKLVNTGNASDPPLGHPVHLPGLPAWTGVYLADWQPTCQCIGMRHSIIVIEDDLNEERPGFFRAYWTDSLDALTQVTVFGYCDRGSHRTIKACVAEALRFYPGEDCYRNGRKLTTEAS